MKIIFKKLFYLIAFLSFSLGAKAQYSAVPDTTRISLGADFLGPESSFADAANFGFGLRLQVDVPLNEKFYFTANLAYDTFMPNDGNKTANIEAIQGVSTPDLNFIPLKVGIKYFLIRTFYVQAEGGAALLLNKGAVYANYNTAFTVDPQIGILLKLPNRKYIDVAFRYERMQSFYGGFGPNNFIGLGVSYALNLK